MIRKSMTLFIAIAVMFALAGAASAGSGTATDPYKVLYVGYTYTFNGVTTTSMGATNVPSVVSNVTGNTVYYNTTYSNINYNSWFIPNATNINSAKNQVAAGNYDYLVVDMFFLNPQYIDPSVNASYWAFYNACNNSTATIGTASIFADDGTTSYAPTRLNFRDSATYTTNVTGVTSRFQNAVNNTNVMNPDYSTFLSYLN